MDRKALLDALHASFSGIAALNDMQRRVWDTCGDRLTVISPTGSGKTIALGGALLQRCGAPGHGLQALVLAPSRELVLQIYDVLRRLAKGYKVAVFYGKHSMTDEVNSLRGEPDIIVATPGRMLDHMQRGTVASGAGLRVLAIDEYDKSLELGFHDEMRRIVRRAGRIDNILLTSATALRHEPDFIDMKGNVTVCAGKPVEQRLHIARVESPARDKLDMLEALLRSMKGGKSIVFVNHREAAERVWNRLNADGIPASLYHGGLEQPDRERAVIQLDNGSARVLVATDLAARGLDIAAVESVIHYHMPASPEAWTHRNGRTARVDAEGNVYVITAEGEDVPEYVVWQHDLVPGAPVEQSVAPVTLYIDAGRREKISRADILGFLTKQAGIPAAEVGKIDLRDHSSYVAVPRIWLSAVAAVKGVKMKNRKVRISALK